MCRISCQEDTGAVGTGPRRDARPGHPRRFPPPALLSRAQAGADLRVTRLAGNGARAPLDHGCIDRLLELFGGRSELRDHESKLRWEPMP
jgi:hypothetical protein